MNGARVPGWLLIAMSLGVAFLVARDLQRGAAGRFVVTPLRQGSPILFRTDTATGESWKLELRAGGETWVPIPGPGAGGLPAPSASPTASAEPPAPGVALPRPLARDEIKALANAIVGEELAPDIRMWAVGQLAVTQDRRATLALIQLLEVVEEPALTALIRAALEQRDDPGAREALARAAGKRPARDE